jgi:hypothetical protein
MRLIKLLDKLSFFDRFIAGPVLTLLMLLAGYILTENFAWITPTLVFPVVVGLSLSVFIGGLRAGFISAALITLYAALSPDFDLVRTVTVASACFLGAYLQGLTKRWLVETTILAQANQKAADLIAAANGNVKLLQRAHKLVTDLYAGWDVLSDEAKKESVNELRGLLATLLTLIAGWEHLAANRRRVIENIDDDNGTIVTHYRIERDKEEPIKPDEWQRFDRENKADE